VKAYPLCKSRVSRSAQANTKAKPANTTVTATATSALSIGIERSLMVSQFMLDQESACFDPDQIT
jgi:hypothetical protein